MCGSGGARPHSRRGRKRRVYTAPSPLHAHQHHEELTVAIDLSEAVTKIESHQQARDEHDGEKPCSVSDGDRAQARDDDGVEDGEEGARWESREQEGWTEDRRGKQPMRHAVDPGEVRSFDEHEKAEDPTKESK